MIAYVRAAFGYFSILPVGGAHPLGAPSAQTLVVLPIVGAAIAALTGGAAYGVSLIAPHSIVVAVAFGLPILLSGAIHYDGFLDSCDALFASVPVQRRLEIFKDAQHGTFAVVGMAIVAVGACAAIGALPVARLWMILPFCAALARLAAVSNALFVPYARADARAVFAEKPSIFALTLEAMVLALAGWPIAGGWAPLAVPLAIAAGLGGGHRLKRRLGGGLVGDVYGYLIVCIELALLVAFTLIPQ